MNPQRLIILTGTRRAVSRAHTETIRAAISDAVNGYPGPNLLIHGDAPGVDTIGKHAAQRMGLTVVGIQARWNMPCQATCLPGHRRTWRGSKGTSTYCPAAGVYRNQEMVDRALQLAEQQDGWDLVCLAFPSVRGSRGTWDCMARVTSAGIVCHEYQLVTL